MHDKPIPTLAACVTSNQQARPACTLSATARADTVARTAIIPVVAMFLAGLALGGCAMGGFTPGPALVGAVEKGENDDPYESFNRSVFEGNQKLNHAIIYPLAKAYVSTIPEPVRDGIDAFATNVGEPVRFTNNLLQLRLKAAATTAGRFALNSTVGLAGLFDVAQTQGLKKQTGDFGQTLYVWGVRDSTYLVLPVVGPTNARDTFGQFVDLAYPGVGIASISGRAARSVTNFSTISTVGTSVSDLGKAEMLEEIEKSSLDFYSKLRSLAQQKRQSELDEGVTTSPFAGVVVAKPAPPSTTSPTVGAVKIVPPASTVGSVAAAPAR